MVAVAQRRLFVAERECGRRDICLRVRREVDVLLLLLLLPRSRSSADRFSAVVCARTISRADTWSYGPEPRQLKRGTSEAKKPPLPHPQGNSVLSSIPPGCGHTNPPNPRRHRTRSKHVASHSFWTSREVRVDGRNESHATHSWTHYNLTDLPTPATPASWRPSWRIRTVWYEHLAACGAWGS